MLFEGQFNPDDNNTIFPAIAKRFSSSLQPIRHIPFTAKPSHDSVLAAVVSSYLSWPEPLLLEQTRRDVTAISELMRGSAWGESHEFKQHFTQLARPEQLRKCRIHGLFMDTYQAKKYQLTHWAPPRTPDAAEIAEFEKMAII